MQNGIDNRFVTECTFVKKKTDIALKKGGTPALLPLF